MYSCIIRLNLGADPGMGGPGGRPIDQKLKLVMAARSSLPGHGGDAVT